MSKADRNRVIVLLVGALIATLFVFINFQRDFGQAALTYIVLIGVGAVFYWRGKIKI